jgi:hypothetical protein
MRQPLEFLISKRLNKALRIINMRSQTKGQRSRNENTCYRVLGEKKPIKDHTVRKLRILKDLLAIAPRRTRTKNSLPPGCRFDSESELPESRTRSPTRFISKVKLSCTCLVSNLPEGLAYLRSAINTQHGSGFRIEKIIISFNHPFLAGKGVFRLPKPVRGTMLATRPPAVWPMTARSCRKSGERRFIAPHLMGAENHQKKFGNLENLVYPINCRLREKYSARNHNRTRRRARKQLILEGI